MKIMRDLKLNIKVISVGKVKDGALLEKIKEYSEKISHDANITFLELKDSNKEEEGLKIIEKVSKSSSFVFILSEEGLEYTSKDFAGKLKKIEQDVIFVIGGPFGLSKEVKKKSNDIISLSKMTFTHEMAKMFLLEQIYRAISINKGRKYHKD